MIGLPVGACLTFVARIGVAGLWWGLFAGLTSVATIGVVALLRTDWEEEARRAGARVDTRQDGAKEDAPAAPAATTTAVVMHEIRPTSSTDDRVRLSHTVA
eukprot:352774-Prymnesium_polylepis.1